MSEAGTPIEVGRAVQHARARLGLTQAEAAQKAGVSRRWLIELERGHGNAQLGKVLATLHALGLTLQVVPHEVPTGRSELDDIVEGTLR
ncbi:MAG TPA: helix-turn-helix transcriptional regulator [Propionibacterium sp.]|nr:helix-turn-helix transcriptional regulator [Propionibacterium sp.]